MKLRVKTRIPARNIAAPMLSPASAWIGLPFSRKENPSLACISHHPTVEAHDTTAMTSLRLLAVLNVLFKYACARQAARASS